MHDGMAPTSVKVNLCARKIRPIAWWVDLIRPNAFAPGTKRFDRGGNDKSDNFNRAAKVPAVRLPAIAFVAPFLPTQL